MRLTETQREALQTYGFWGVWLVVFFFCILICSYALENLHRTHKHALFSQKEIEIEKIILISQINGPVFSACNSPTIPKPGSIGNITVTCYWHPWFSFKFYVSVQHMSTNNQKQRKASEYPENKQFLKWNFICFFFLELHLGSVFLSSVPCKAVPGNSCLLLDNVCHSPPQWVEVDAKHSSLFLRREKKRINNTGKNKTKQNKPERKTKREKKTRWKLVSSHRETRVEEVKEIWLK